MPERRLAAGPAWAKRPRLALPGTTGAARGPLSGWRATLFQTGRARPSAQTYRSRRSSPSRLGPLGLRPMAGSPWGGDPSSRLPLRAGRGCRLEPAGGEPGRWPRSFLLRAFGGLPQLSAKRCSAGLLQPSLARYLDQGGAAFSPGPLHPRHRTTVRFVRAGNAARPLLLGGDLIDGLRLSRWPGSPWPVRRAARALRRRPASQVLLRHAEQGRRVPAQAVAGPARLHGPGARHIRYRVAVRKRLSSPRRSATSSPRSSNRDRLCPLGISKRVPRVRDPRIASSPGNGARGASRRGPGPALVTRPVGGLSQAVNPAWRPGLAR